MKYLSVKYELVVKVGKHGEVEVISLGKNPTQDPRFSLSKAKRLEGKTIREAREILQKKGYVKAKGEINGYGVNKFIRRGRLTIQ